MPWLFNRRVLGSVAAVVAVVLLITFTARERREFTIVEELFHELMAPLAGGIKEGVTKVRRGVGALGDLGRLREENEFLRQEVDRLSEAEHRARVATDANERLHSLLGLKMRLGVPVVAARVIGRSPNNWFDRIVLDAGSADGIQPDMVVVHPRGVVGRVVSVTPNTAAVMLLTDPASGVGGLVARSRDAGIVLGSHRISGRLLMRFFSHDVSVEEGDLITTSGLGGLFPKDLEIGTVELVEHNPVTLQTLATVRPAVDFLRLEEVLVISLLSEQLPGAPDPGSDGEDVRPPGTVEPVTPW